MRSGVHKLATFLVVLLPGALLAQDRIAGSIDRSRMVPLRSGAHPMAGAEFDRGPVDPARKLGYVTIHLAPSPAQQAALEKLLEEQREPASPNYHKWLTPEQFADRFGASSSDVGKIARWLQSEGLNVERQARGRNWIAFSGTAESIGRVLRTEFHRYVVKGEEHFANATAPSVPAALDGVVSGFVGLDDFGQKPLFTNSDGTHSLAPDDIATIYDVAPLYKMGLDGTGITIVITGATDLEPNFADLRAFRAKFNLPPKDPQVITVGPSPGLTAAIGEADLDIEWSGAVARNAKIVYVESADFGVSGAYAVDQNLGQIISNSAGRCEQNFMFQGSLYRSIIQQANAQGITFLSGSGDAGPATCDGWFSEPEATDGLATFFPASIPEITAVGGTELNEGSGTYWGASNAPNGGSALSYIPEKAWNDTAALGVIAASSGGPSILYAKPGWQTGPGVPNDNARDVPDVAMPASGYHDGYYVCYSGACSGNNGGTSIATPVFAGIVALLNQSLVSRGVLSQPGLGNINPTLYRLAASGSNAFHDITVGDNIVPCVIGTPNCTTGKLGYTAGPGYDLVTGLGSVDALNLVNAWNTNGAQATLSVTASASSVTMSDPLQLMITVSPAPGSSSVPTGSVFVNQSKAPEPPLVTNGPTVASDQLLGTGVLMPGTRPSATAAVTIYPGTLTAGADTVTVTYPGDAIFNGSSASIALKVSVPSGHSAVVPSVYPSYYTVQNDPPVGEPPPVAGSRFQYLFQLQLNEVAGVGTTLDTLIVNGSDVSSSILSAGYFQSEAIAPMGSLVGGAGFFPGYLTPPGPVSFGFGGHDAGGYRWSTQVSVPIAAAPEQFVYLPPGALGNGASFRPVFAPGMILSVFGINLANPENASGQADSLPLPLTLAGSSAKINGVPAPYYYASYGQLNIQIPYETAPGLAVLTITGVYGQTFNYSFNVQPSAPGIFAGPGNTAVPYASGSRGGTYTLFITGEGQVTPALATGATPDPSTPYTNLPHPVLPVSMTIGGENTPIAFIGIPSGLAGVTQVNFTVPTDAPLGTQPVVVTVGNASSPPVNFTVNP